MTSKKNYKSCFVPQCKSTTCSTPDKLFISVPKTDPARTKWFKACRRVQSVSLKTTLYCCEDHFNLEDDVENLRFVRTFKSSGKTPIRLRAGVLPSRFDCQESRFLTGRKHRPSAVREKLGRKQILKHLLESHASGEKEQRAPESPLESDFHLRVELAPLSDNSVESEDELLRECDALCDSLPQVYENPLESDFHSRVEVAPLSDNSVESEDELLRECDALCESLPQVYEKGVQANPILFDKAVQTHPYVRSKQYQIRPNLIAHAISPLKTTECSTYSPPPKRLRLSNERNDESQSNALFEEKEESVISSSFVVSGTSAVSTVSSEIGS